MSSPDDNLSPFALHVNFSKKLESLSHNELMLECKELRTEFIQIAKELDRLKAELKSKKKKPNTTGFLRDIGLKDWENITLFRLALLRLANYPDKPKTIDLYDADIDDISGEITYPPTYTTVPNPWHIDEFALDHSTPLRRPIGVYMDSLKSALHLVITDKLERELTGREYDDMNDRFFDEGYMRQVLRKICFRDPYENK